MVGFFQRLFLKNQEVTMEEKHNAQSVEKWKDVDLGVQLEKEDEEVSNLYSKFNLSQNELGPTQFR